MFRRTVEHRVRFLWYAPRDERPFTKSPRLNEGQPPPLRQGGYQWGDPGLM